MEEFINIYNGKYEISILGNVRKKLKNGRIKNVKIYTDVDNRNYILFYEKKIHKILFIDEIYNKLFTEVIYININKKISCF